MNFDPFSGVELAPRDPILGVNEAFAADARPTKVNLGVGVYTNEEGKIPLLRAVREAEPRWSRRPSRVAICRSMASPPTTRQFNASCSEKDRPCSPAVVWSRHRHWAEPAL